MKKSASRFMEQIIDWKEFEQFIAKIYLESDDVKVEHDITLIGKSKAKRQIDVLVTQLTPLHEYKTIIECKRWKKPVTRQVIDVLYASVEDLNANKGVIFTTKGFEEGAIEYAKSKNIDIFIVRDIRDDEFGGPGKEFSLYLQCFNAKLTNFDVQNAKFLSLDGEPMSKPISGFNIQFSENQSYPEEHQLISIDEEKGPNLVKLLIDIRAKMIENTRNLFNYLIQPEDERVEVADRVRVNLDFSKYNYKYLKHGNGLIMLDKFKFDLTRHISQNKMNFDRVANMDIALVVENYITNQKNVVSKAKNESDLKLSAPLVDYEKSDNEVKDNSIIKISLAHYVALDIKNTTLIKEANEITVNLENKASS